jgi:peptide/nickel transport system ATP-binding protein
MIKIKDLVVNAGDRVIASLPELDVGPGQCAAIVGESGSGKTTTLLATLGLLTYGEISGKIVVDGVDVLHASHAELRRLRGSRAALVTQSPQAALNPTMRLGTLMRRALARHGVRGEVARRRAAEAVAAVLLDVGLLRRYPHQVSGGQAQRFVIALALALGADIILADEPTSALDVTVQAEVIGVLRRLRDERGLAVLMVSHDLALVSTIADHVVVMKDGRVVESGPDILAHPRDPYTRELLDAVPDLDRPC